MEPEGRTPQHVTLERLREELARQVAAGGLPSGPPLPTAYDRLAGLGALAAGTPFMNLLRQDALTRSYGTFALYGHGATAALAATGAHGVGVGGVLTGLPFSPSLLGVSSGARSLVGESLFGPSALGYGGRGRLPAYAVGTVASSALLGELLPYLRVRGIADVSAHAAGLGLLGMSPATHSLLTANRFLDQSRAGLLGVPGRIGPLDAGVAGVTAASGLLDLDRASRRRTWPSGLVLQSHLV